MFSLIWATGSSETFSDFCAYNCMTTTSHKETDNDAKNRTVSSPSSEINFRQEN